MQNVQINFLLHRPHPISVMVLTLLLSLNNFLLRSNHLKIYLKKKNSKNHSNVHNKIVNSDKINYHKLLYFIDDFKSLITTFILLLDICDRKWWKYFLSFPFQVPVSQWLHPRIHLEPLSSRHSSAMYLMVSYICHRVHWLDTFLW